MKNFLKKRVALVAGTLALVAFAGMAQAETRLAVQDATGTVDKMVVTDTGKIGVGTSNPTAGVTIAASTYPENSLRIEAKDFSGGILAYLTKAGTALPVKEERLGFIYMGALDNSTNPATALNAAGMRGAADGIWSSTSTPSYFAFETTPAGSFGTSGRKERLRIDSNGNVGVGSSDTATGTFKVLSQKLEVYGGIRVYPVTPNASANTDTPTNATKPTCSASTRGTIWLTPTSSTDTIEICMKNNGSYLFKSISITP